MRLLISFLILILFFIPNCFAATTLESLPNHGERSILNAIDSAQHSLQITMYGFTDKKIAEALIKKHTQGINIQLLIEDEPYKASEENSKIVKKLKNAGILIHYNHPKFSLTHQKTLLIDQKQAIILTGNFTYSGFYHQRNFIVITDDLEITQNLHKLFESDWNHTKYAASEKTSLITSPENSWKILHALIKNTRNSLDIYALELTDKRIIQALINQKAKTRIIISKTTKLIDKSTLCQHSIKIRRLKKIDQHAKALLRDYGLSNSLAYVGSANLSYYSLSKNREAGILFSDKVALKKLNATFEQDWKHSRSIC